MTSPQPNVGTATTVADTTSLTSRNIAAPSDAANKAVYIAAVLDGTGDLSSTGFTAILNNIPILSSAETANLALLRKVEGASPPANYAIASTTSERVAGLCWAQSSPDNGLDPGKTAVAEGTGTTATASSLTPSEASTTALLVVATDRETSPHSTPSGWTKIGTVESVSGGTISVYYMLLPTVAATGTPAVTVNVAEEWVAAIVIIKGDGAVAGSGAGALVNGVRLKSKLRGLAA